MRWTDKSLGNCLFPCSESSWRIEEFLRILIFSNFRAEKKTTTKSTCHLGIFYTDKQFTVLHCLKNTKISPNTGFLMYSRCIMISALVPNEHVSLLPSAAVWYCLYVSPFDSMMGRCETTSHPTDGVERFISFICLLTDCLQDYK